MSGTAGAIPYQDASDALASGGAFLDEADGYALLTQSGWQVPRHTVDPDTLPFAVGAPIVLKGLADELWHKSELGCVQFMACDAAAVATAVANMRTAAERAGHRWRRPLVCERVSIAHAPGLPSEGFVSLTRHEAGWIALVGFGGLSADRLATLAPPLRWPLARMTPAEALREFGRHPLGEIWLGTLRGTSPLLSAAAAGKFIASLWAAAVAADEAGVTLLELNPVVVTADGLPCPLDAVGRFGPRGSARRPAPTGLLEVLRAPKRIALAGVSAQPGGIGRTILENVQRCAALGGRIVLLKPGVAELAGCPCIADVGPLRDAPVDLLILAVPAVAAVDIVRQLMAQGGGATVVALVSGGLGDGADRVGLGERLRAELREVRTAGRWTPVLLGPNFLGHWVPAIGLDTSFIPVAKLPVPRASTGATTQPRGGLTLLSQSGAYLLSRRSRQPWLRFDLAVALGNQFDVAVPDLLAAIAAEPGVAPVAIYLEGFAPGELAATVDAAAVLHAHGGRVVIYRAGRTALGRAAAASHTGAMAGDCELERTLLERVGVRFARDIAQFDAVCGWLSAYPNLSVNRVAVLSNAGFETVNAADLAAEVGACTELSAPTAAELAGMLAEENLADLVAPRLPLDLTPMAGERAFSRAIDVLARGGFSPLVAGLVPFTPRLQTDATGATAGAAALAEAACRSRVPLGVVVDAGADYEPYRAAFAMAGVAVFTRMEDALQGLSLLR